ncbi:MAG: M1 family metallopeptidase [Terrisporobacter sp.]|uniref:M1 family metallopeptidase n=1 Tax=Terrisporobacter sp. TaxID=1965305 RepID=UPI002FCAEA65
MVINFTKKKRRLFVIILALLIIITGVICTFIQKNERETFTLKDEKNKNQYTIDVILDDETNRILCNENLVYVNNTKTTLDKVYLHIYPNAFCEKKTAPFEDSEMAKAYPKGFNEGYIDIKNISNNKNDMEYKITGDKDDILEINLGSLLKEGESISLDIKFNVKLPNCLGRFGYGENTINVTNWFPIACVYDNKGWNLKSYETIGDPFYSDTSNFNVTLLAPQKYKLATTGKVTEKKSDNEKIMYKVDGKMVRDFAFILSEKFTETKTNYKDISISTYNLNEDMSKEATDIAKSSIEIFSNLFGDYPYDNYSVVATDFFIGGMEYPMLVMIDQNLYNNENKFLLEYVIAHETAHQWWYSVIGNDEIEEPWLDEALTEYSTILYFEDKYGKEAADKLMKTMEIQTQNYRCTDIFKATTEYKDSADYSLSVYTKGAVIFNEIRTQVGDEVFFDTLKEYYSKYKFKNVNGTQFVELWKSKGVDIEKIIKEYK